MRPVLEGKLARLRSPREDDLAFALAFANDEGLRGYLRFYRPTGEAEERDWLASLRDDGDLVWLIEDVASRERLGFASLTVDHVASHAELGIGILDASRRGAGRGGDVMTLLLDHAFGALGLQRVHLNVVEDNPARRLYERLGFRVEGRLRRHVFKRGEHRDQLVMGILAEEWRG